MPCRRGDEGAARHHAALGWGGEKPQPVAESAGFCCPYGDLHASAVMELAEDVADTTPAVCVSRLCT